VLSALCLCALIAAPGAPNASGPAAFAQTVALSADGQKPASDPKPENGKTKKKKDPDDQDEKPAKKPKKAKKKKAAVQKPSPDEADEADVSEDVIEKEPELVAPKAGPSTTWKQHPRFQVGDVFRLDLEMKLQEDGHSAYGPVKGLTPWEFHRNRFGIKGFVTRKVEYEVEHEFTEHELTEKDIELGVTPKSRWKDVNVNLSYMKHAQVQIGKFKVPFGLDELTGVTHNDFVYRSMGAQYLDPGRDIGTMVHGRFLKRGLNYWVGAFLKDGDNATSKKIAGGGHTVAGRVSGTPFRKLTGSALGQIEVGSAFAISQLSDDSYEPNGLRGRTVMTQDYFFESVYVKGQRRRWESDVDWTVGRASTRAEYTWVSDDRLAQGIGDENLPNARAQAWYVTGTYVVTGENKRRPLQAAEPFAQGGIGAIELAVRYERLWFDSSPAGQDVPLRNPRAETILSSGDQALTFGVSWTLNRFVKIQVNGIREHVEDPQRSPVPNSSAFWSRVVRLQLVL
jgi:phosphate-selective porin OprO and OprP